jgi:hypothetical protein
MQQGPKKEIKKIDIVNNILYNNFRIILKYAYSLKAQNILDANALVRRAEEKAVYQIC